MKRRVVVALRPVSPVARLLSVGASLCRRMEAELEVLADPARPDWKELENRLTEGLSDYNEIQKISAEILKVTQHLDEKSLRWLEIQEEL